MPWTKDDADRFIEGLTDKQKEKWASAANNSLQQCLDDGGKQDECEAKAIRIANSQVSANEQAQSELALRHNMSNLVEERTLENKKYLVAPTVMIVEGVLNNAYYPADEIADCPEDWNGRPVLIDHSTTESGMPKSANEPEEREKRTVGWIFHAHYENGKLKAEAWIDPEKCKQVQDGDIVLQRLENNEGLEVSTGLRAKHLQQNGEFSGKEYDWIAMQLRADHLALLPNSKGACSWEDGAGMPRINEAKNQDEDTTMKIVQNIRNEARTPDYDGTESGDWNAPDMEACIAGYWKHHPDADRPDDEVSSVDAMPAAMKSWIASLSLLGDSEANDFDNLLYFPVVDPDTHNLNESALDAVIAGRGAQADAPSRAVNSARRKAYNLLNEEFNRDLDIPDDIQNESKWERLANGIAEKLGLKLNKEKMDMERNEKIQALVDNEKFGEQDVASLQALSDDALNVLYENIQSESEGDSENEADSQEAESQETQNEQSGVKVEQMSADEFIKQAPDPEMREFLQARLQEHRDEKENLVKDLVQNERCKFSETQLKAKSVDELKVLKEMASTPDYSGQGGSYSVSEHKDADEGREDLPEMPSV